MSTTFRNPKTGRLSHLKKGSKRYEKAVKEGWERVTTKKRRREVRRERREKVVERSIEKAEKALEEAEQYKQAYGSVVKLGDKTYDLGTTAGWRAYQQALRESRSEIQAAKREFKEYKFGVITSQAPKPVTKTTLPFTRAEVAEVGPPKIASDADRRRLEGEGYDLPKDRTIYISPSGEVYYYEEEIPDAPMSMSAKLWAEAMATPGSKTGRLLGIPYSEKGVRQIGAVLAGSVERATTPITGLIPGKQPFEITPGMDTFSLYDLTAAEDLSETEKRVAAATGVTAEAALSFGLFAGVQWISGTVIGASGALVSRLPVAGPALERGGAYVAGKLGTPLGGALMLGAAAAVEAPRVIDIVKEDKAIGYELLMEAGRVSGSFYGFTRGLSYGKTLPARVERAMLGGVTVPEEAIVPGYVTEEGGFPRFSEEPYKPTAAGYREMAETYAPPEMRVTEDGVPSWHATPGRLKDETVEGFTTMVGKRPGEAGMFYAPGASKHFLRLEGGYTLRPGVPNIFAEPQLIYGEFTGVAETGLSKISPELAKLLEESAGTGKLLMPTGQLEEAQAILGPGTEMARVAEGRFWADIGGKPVKLERFIPKGAFPDISTKGVETMERLMAKQAATVSSLTSATPTSYMPFIPSTVNKELKRIESEMRRVSASVSKPIGSFTVPSYAPSGLPSTPSISGVTVTSRDRQRRTGKPSRQRPSPTSGLPSVEYPSPSVDYPEPSEPGYDPTTPSPTKPSPSKPSPIFPSLPDIPGYPPADTVYRPKPRRKKRGEGRKKRRAAAERRLDPLAWTFPEVKVPEIATPKMEDVELKIEVPKFE